MRLVLLAALSCAVAGAAFAQAPRITIEDDVSHTNAMKCAGLRTAQAAASATPDAAVQAARDAWVASLKQAGHDAATVDKDVKAEAAQLATSSPEAMSAMARGCTPFEIRAPG